MTDPVEGAPEVAPGFVDYDPAEHADHARIIRVLGKIVEFLNEEGMPLNDAVVMVGSLATTIFSQIDGTQDRWAMRVYLSNLIFNNGLVFDAKVASGEFKRKKIMPMPGAMQ